MFNQYLETPCGTMEVIARDSGVAAIQFVEAEGASSSSRVTKQACSQLREYFALERRDFSLPLAPSGTPFQLKVWNALSQIRYGDVSSYKAIAEQIDNPKGSRAIGLANSKNPLTIVVPCHRVIGANGKLTGYAGGLQRKLYLLKLEGAVKPYAG